jgi:ABC-type branched-subunit amino acid transport system ATPase component
MGLPMLEVRNIHAGYGALSVLRGIDMQIAEGEVVVIADGDAFEVLGRTPLGEPCRATPAVADGRMFFRSVGRLLALDAIRADSSTPR